VVPLRVLSRTNSLRSAAANSFRFRSYANRPILHFFGANKSFRFRSYRHPTRNPFRFRSYKYPEGWWGAAAPSNFYESQITSRKSRPSIRRPYCASFTSPTSSTSCISNSFRINTCISVASKQLYLPLESTLVKKRGEGEGCVNPNPNRVFSGTGTSVNSKEEKGPEPGVLPVPRVGLNGEEARPVSLGCFTRASSAYE